MVRVMIKVGVLGLGLVVGLGLGLIIPTCRANLVLRVIWQCEIFGMTLAFILTLTLDPLTSESMHAATECKCCLLWCG